MQGVVSSSYSRDAVDMSMWILYLALLLRLLVQQQKPQPVLKGAGVLGDYAADIFSALEVLTCQSAWKNKLNAFEENPVTLFFTSTLHFPRNVN